MRVLILHPPVSIGRDFVDQPFQSDLGAVQLGAVLRARFDVRLVDALAVRGAGVAEMAGARLRLGASPERVAEEVRHNAPFDAAVIVTTPFHRPPHRDVLLGAACAAVRDAAPDAVVMLADCHQSGQHYVEAPGDAMLASYPEADAWVKYEAEASVAALLESFRSGGPRPKGLHRGAEADLPTLPVPAWDLVDLSARDAFHAEVVERAGRGSWPFPIDGRTLPLVTSRGCPFRCLHCSSNPGREPGAPKLQRRVPVDRVRAACSALVKRFGCTRLMVLDEMVNADPEHLDALLAAGEALHVGLELPNGVRADLLRRDQIERMRGRITTLSVSAESGVQRVVDQVVRKGLDLREIERVAADAQEAGIPLIVHYMIGLPGESAAEVNGTLEHALSLHERFGVAPALQFATPLPGTALAESAPPAALEDFGSAFQAQPCAAGSEVRPERLARFRWAFDRRMEADRSPEKLILNLTYRCNNRCVFCAVGNRVRRDGDPLRQRRTLERYRRDGVRLVDFDGGEPTLSPALLPLVRHASALGYERISVTTNGRRCSYPAFARALAGSGITTALVSLHGPDPEAHGRAVGVPDAFDQTVQGIRNLVRFGDRLELGVNTTIARENAGSLDRLVALVFDLGIRWMNFQFLTPFGRATRDHAPDLGAAAAQVSALIDRWQCRMRLGVVNLPFCLMPGQERFLAPDLGKALRRMAFVNDEEVNLGAYLAQRRVRREQCGSCEYAACCGGFYELDDVPEPPWLGAEPGSVEEGTGAISPSPNRAR